MKLADRFISLTLCLSLVISSVYCSDVSPDLTSPSSKDLQPKPEDAEGWARLAKEAGLDETEFIVSSQDLQLAKRSDPESESETTEKPLKKKPVMYSWWMPNMAAGGQPAVPVTTSEFPATESEPQTTEGTTKPTTGKRPRPTRKPRPSLRPRTRRPSSVDKDTESPAIPTTSTTSSPKTVATTKPVSKVKLTTTPTSTSTTTSTEPSSAFLNAVAIKKKLINVAKIVGGVVLIAKGTAGQLALSTTGVEPYVKVAGKVGSLALSAAGQVGTLAAPVAKNVATHAGTFAATALSKAGSLAVVGAEKALEALKTRLSASSEQEDCEKELKNSKSVNEVLGITTPVIATSTSTRAIKTSPPPPQVKETMEQKPNVVDPDVEMEVMQNDKPHSTEHPSKLQPKHEKSAPDETSKGKHGPTMRMSARDNKNFGVSDKAGLGVICCTLGMQLLLNRLNL